MLDAGAFVAAERWDRRLATFLAAGEDAEIVIPAAVVAEIWRQPPRARSSALIESADDIEPLTLAHAREVGALLGTSATTQIADACVATLAAACAPSLVLTSDVADIERLLTAMGVACRVGSTSRLGAPVSIEQI